MSSWLLWERGSFGAPYVNAIAWRALVGMMPVVTHSGRACAHGDEDPSCPHHGDGLVTSCVEDAPGVFRCAHLIVRMPKNVTPPRPKAARAATDKTATDAATVTDELEPLAAAVPAGKKGAAKKAPTKRAAKKPPA